MSARAFGWVLVVVLFVTSFASRASADERDPEVVAAQERDNRTRELCGRALGAGAAIALIGSLVLGAIVITDLRYGDVDTRGEEGGDLRPAYAVAGALIGAGHIIALPPLVIGLTLKYEKQMSFRLGPASFGASIAF